MKIILISIFIFFLNNSLEIENNNKNSIQSNSVVQKNEVYTKIELISFYIKKGYKPIYNKKHKSKDCNNHFFIFEQEIKGMNFKQNRVLIFVSSISKKKYKIISVLDDLIYFKNSTITCYSGDNKETFNKIVTKGNFITIEQNRCTSNHEEILHEYFTFKFDKDSNDYFLTKFSCVLEQTKIGDSFLFSTFSEKDFGKINLSDFSNKEFDKVKL